jgi:hypothetical protein
MSKKEVNPQVLVRVKKLRVHVRVPYVVTTLDAVKMRVMRLVRYMKSMGLIEMKLIVAVLKVFLLPRMLREIMGRVVIKAGRVTGLR